MNRTWTPEEFYILRTYYPKEGSLGCINRGLNRSKNVIQSKAAAMRIAREQAAWQRWELDILTTHYFQVGSKGCRELGVQRPVKKIADKACMLGLKRQGYSRARRQTFFWTEDELKLLWEHYPRGGARAVLDAGIKKTRKQICDRACRDGLRVVITQIDRVGQQVGGLTILSEYPLVNKKGRYVTVQCDQCGTVSENHRLSMVLSNSVQCKVCKDPWKIPVAAELPVPKKRPVPELTPAFSRFLSDVYAGQYANVLKIRGG